MLHWNADTCIQTFTNVACTTVQWLWLKRSSSNIHWLTSSDNIEHSSSQTIIIMKCCWMFFFFPFFFFKSYKKSTSRGRTQHFNISHRKCRQKCSCEKKAGARCWLCLQSSGMHIRGVMQIQGCWGNAALGSSKGLKRRSDSVKAVGWTMLLILHFFFLIFVISLATNYSCHMDFDSTSITLKTKKNKKIK